MGENDIGDLCQIGAAERSLRHVGEIRPHRFYGLADVQPARRLRGQHRIAIADCQAAGSRNGGKPKVEANQSPLVSGISTSPASMEPIGFQIKKAE